MYEVQRNDNVEHDVDDNVHLRDGNLGPVFGLQGLGQRFELAGADFHGLSGFTFFLLFTNGKHNLQAGRKSNFGLLGTKIDGMASAESAVDGASR